MRITTLIVATTTALALAACGETAETKAPEATTEAVEAAGIADQTAVDATIEQTAADAKAAAEAAEATTAAQAQPEDLPATTPAAPVEKDGGTAP